MDLKGSLIDTNLKIYPDEKLINFIKTIQDNDVPKNFHNFINTKKGLEAQQKHSDKKEIKDVQFTDKDIENLKEIKETVKKLKTDVVKESSPSNNDTPLPKRDTSLNEKSEDSDETNADTATDTCDEIIPQREEPYLTTVDINWLHIYLTKKRQGDKKVPYLHELLEGTNIETPRNSVLKRNPVLEARCVKLRSQQEAREYRKMTRSVDNVRIRFPDDSIAYQLKQLNRQLIAIGQFIISIFAGFLFGFKGVEWTLGPMDFGFRLLLGVMCALVIALAEIYFLAKKLNEELNVPETSQLGGPPKFVDTKTYNFEPRAADSKTVASNNKEHQD